MLTIHSRFNLPPKKIANIEGDSLAQQCFKDDADINVIIARYTQTGFLTDPLNPSTQQPMFGEFVGNLDFHSVQTQLAHAQQSFDLLPAALRKRFSNDPGQLLAFLDDETNREEAEKLGIIQGRSQENPGSITHPVSPD